MTCARLATRASSASSGIQVQASVELMDDYVFASDLTGASDISVARTAAGTDRIFYMGASGAMSLFQDPTSDTGWTEEALGQPDNGLTALCGAQGSDGIAVAFGIGANTAGADVFMTRRGADGTWAAWTLVAPSAAVPPLFNATAIEAMPVGGAATLFAILAPSPNSPATGPACLWTVDWEAAAPVWTLIAQTDQQVLEPCTVTGAGAGLLFGRSNAATPTLVDLFQVPAPFTGPPAILATAISFTSLAVGLGPSGNSIVAIADNGYQSGNVAISALDCANPQAGFAPLDTGITATALCVTDAGDTPAAIFVLDASGLLNLIDSDGAGNWQAALNMQLPCSSLAAATDVQGQGELYAWMTGKGLHRTWRSPRPPGDGTPGPGPWSQQPVQYDPVNQSLTQQSTYVTALTFYDANGAVMPNQAVTLRASQIISASAAGLAVVLGPDNDTTCTTDAAGRLRLTTPTDSVSTAQISASVPGLMDALEDFAITPNAKAQKRLSVISQTDLLKFLNPQYANDVAQVQQAVQAAMTAVQPSDGWRTVRARPNGAHVHRTPLRTEGMQAFRLDVERGKATYTALSPAEAGAAVAAFNIGPRHSVDGFFDFFEDVVDAIGDAFESAIDFVGTYIITPIANAIEVALNFVIDGITYAVQGVIDTVEQAFEAVESVFNAVLTFFKDLYNFLAWLLSSARQDIWNTKSHLQTQLTSTVSQLATLAAQGGTVASNFFATLEQAIDQAFTSLEEELTGVSANQALNLELPSQADGVPDAIMDLITGAASTSNWLFDKVESVLFGIGMDPSFPAQMISDCTAFLAQAAATITTAITDAINAFLTQMETFAASRAALASIALATIVEAAKDALLLVLRVVDGLVRDFLKLVSNNVSAAMTALCTASVSNMLVTAVYDLLNPGDHEDVTVEGLICLMCAFPATVLYKVMFDTAPYPVDAKGEFHPGDATGEMNLLLIFSGAISCFPWGVIDPMIDFAPLSEIEPGWKIAALIIVPTLMNGLAFPNPSTPPDPAFDTARFVSWTIGFCSPLLALWWAIATGFKQGPRADPGGCAILSLVGLMGLGANIHQLVVPKADPQLPDWKKAILVLAPLSNILKPLKISVNPIAKGALLLTDFLCDEAVGVVRIVDGSKRSAGSTARAAAASGG